MGKGKGEGRMTARESDRETTGGERMRSVCKKQNMQIIT